MENYKKLQTHLDKMAALETALTMMNWDVETLAPRGGVERTAKMVGLLSSAYYEELVSPEVKALLNALAQPEEQKKLDDGQRAIVRTMKKDFDRMEKIPPEEYQAYSELTATSGTIWAEAREKKDFALFAPTLKKIVAYQKRFADYTRKQGQSRYDALLDQYEEGITTSQLDPFFAVVREAVVPLLKRIQQAGPVEKPWLGKKYPIETQREICRKLAEHIGFDFHRGVAAESAHPFTTELHKDDVRFTNHYFEQQPESAMFSAIHEGGHGIYEQNIADGLTQTPVGHGTSMGMHESQSRFYENVLGRSEAFWTPLWPMLQQAYPQQLEEVTLSQFIRGINLPEPSLIRTEADELTYPLHIMVRYEIEKMLMEDQITVEQLPQEWNRQYQEYLGLTPPDDGVGVLQDVHWSGGMFGYFPSYALGSAIAAQILAWLKTKVDVDQLLRSGDLAPIREILTEHIYRYGASRNTDQLLRGMTGEGFNAKYFIDYLTEKYEALYLQ